MRKSIEWMKTHPVVPFFILALALMYLLFLPALYMVQKGLADRDLVQILILYMSRLAVYSPVLAGMLVTRWTLPVRGPVSASKRWFTFGIVWLVALIISTIDLKRSNSDPTVGWVPMLILSIPIAILPAYIVSTPSAGLAACGSTFQPWFAPEGIGSGTLLRY